MNNCDVSQIEKKVFLDLKIIKFIHALEEINKRTSTSFESNPEYKTISKQLIDNLVQQKVIDAKRFNLNCSKIKCINMELKEEIEKIEPKEEIVPLELAILKKLSITERNFIIKNNYDCVLDEYKIFSIEKSPNNSFVSKWLSIQIKKHNKSPAEYYKDRDWNN